MVFIYLTPFVRGHNSKSNGTNTQTPPISHGPAIPISFEHPIQIKGETYPFHSDQEIVIQPKNNDWIGKNVTLYRILPSATQEETNKFLMEKVLPTDVEKIGTIAIKNGTWSFPWKVPNQNEKNKYGGFWIAVESDSGIVSGTSGATFDYKKLQLSPSNVEIGMQVKVTGEGFHKDSDIEIYLERDEPQIHTNRLAKLGSLHTKDGSFSYAFELSKEMDGHEITKGEYIIGFIVIPKNEQRERVDAFLQVE